MGRAIVNWTFSPRSPLPPAAPSDAELLRRFQAGDLSAFSELLERWQEPVYLLARRITCDAFAAEDVRQEVFLRLLRTPGAIEHGERFAAWIRRATANRAISLLRRLGTRLRLLRERFARGGPSTAGPNGSAELVEAEEEALRLERAVAALEPLDRAILSLRFDGELGFQEIADALSRPASTIKSRYERALARLRGRLRNPETRR